MNFRMLFISAFVTVSAVSSLAAHAAIKSVTLSVPGMTCSLCPITVKQALMKVSGVKEADVTYEERQAVVTYDDAKTGPNALMEATRNAGYPSTVKGGK